MLTEQPILITSIKCTEIDSIAKNRFINFNGTYGTDGAKALGVVNAETNTDEMTPVIVKGIALVETYGPIPKGSPIQAFDDGLATVVSSGPLEGYAMDAAAGANQLIRILLS